MTRLHVVIGMRACQRLILHEAAHDDALKTQPA